jgi:hypothetical protein
LLSGSGGPSSGLGLGSNFFLWGEGCCASDSFGGGLGSGLVCHSFGGGYAGCLFGHVHFYL